MQCIYCGRQVVGWYQRRWYGEKPGPTCQACWDEEFLVPGYPEDHAGVDYPEEAEPAFHILRYQLIKKLGDQS